RDQAYWESHLESITREGIGTKAYAQREGIAISSLYYWRRRLKAQCHGPQLLTHGVCQCSWNMSHAASSSLCTWITVVSFSGFSQTLPTGCQFRVLPDQRAGC